MCTFRTIENYEALYLTFLNCSVASNYINADDTKLVKVHSNENNKERNHQVRF